MDISNDLRLVFRAVDLESYEAWLEEFTLKGIESDDERPTFNLVRVNLNLDDMVDSNVASMVSSFDIKVQRDRFKELVKEDFLSIRRKVIPFYVEAMTKGLQLVSPEGLVVYDYRICYASRMFIDGGPKKVDLDFDFSYRSFVIFDLFNRHRFLFKKKLENLGGSDFCLNISFNESNDYNGFTLDDLGVEPIKINRKIVPNSFMNDDYSQFMEDRICYNNPTFSMIQNLLIPYIRRRFDSAIVKIK